MKSERNLQDDEDILASRTLTELLDEADAIEAANPYGCNQYGEGWKQPHNGKQSKKGSAAKKDDSSSAAEKKAKQTKKRELPESYKKYLKKLDKQIEELEKKAEEAFSLLDEERQKAIREKSDISLGIAIGNIDQKRARIKYSLQMLKWRKAQVEEAIYIITDPDLEPEKEPEGSLRRNIGKESTTRKLNYDAEKEDLLRQLESVRNPSSWLNHQYPTL